MILNDKTSSGNIIGRVLLVDKYNTYVYNQRTERIEINKSKFLPEYLYQLLNSDNIREKIICASQGNTQIYVNWTIIREFTYKITTDIEEQGKIARFFISLDHLITLHQSKSFWYILKSIVSCTLYWEQRKLGEIVNVCNGRDYKHLLEGDIPVYGTGGYMISVNKALSYDRDAIGIGRKGTIDKPYILNAPFWTVDTLFYVIPRDKIALIFAFGIFQNIEWEKKDESTGVPSLSKAAINEIDVLIPKYEEQQVLGIFFNGLDHLITLHQLEPFQLIFKAIAYRIIDYTKSKPPNHIK